MRNSDNFRHFLENLLKVYLWFEIALFSNVQFPNFYCIVLKQKSEEQMLNGKNACTYKRFPLRGYSQKNIRCQFSSNLKFYKSIIKSPPYSGQHYLRDKF